MANPQLTSYIKQQLGLGDPESSIKNNLRSVGWAEPDIVEAFKEVSPAPAASTPAAQPMQPAAKPVAPSTPSFTPQTTQPMANPAPAQPNLNPTPTTPRKIDLGSFAPMSASPVVSRPFSASPAVISFTAQPPMENIFQPKAANPNPGMPAMNMNPNPSPMSVSPAANLPSTGAKKSWGSTIIMVIMVLIIAGLGWFAWTQYQGNASLTNQLNALNGQVNSLSGQQSANSQNQATLTSLQNTVEDLQNQLAFLTATSSATTTLNGVIGGGGKLSYTLTTKWFVVTVKNSKDAKVIATLSPLVGSTATLTGTTVPGTHEINVTLVNGAAPALPVPVATTTPPVTTTTPPAPVVPPAPAPAP